MPGSIIIFIRSVSFSRHGGSMDRLSGSKIEVDYDATLKEAGERCDIDPIEILKIILVEDYSIVL
jgi:hypothetical protein